MTDHERLREQYTSENSIKKEEANYVYAKNSICYEATSISDV